MWSHNRGLSAFVILFIRCESKGEERLQELGSLEFLVLSERHTNSMVDSGTPFILACELQRLGFHYLVEKV